MIFGSDNQTGASSTVLEMMAVANQGYTQGYGKDQWTKQAIDGLKQNFECELEAYFVATGTAANTLALSCLVQPWEAILCHHQAHILLDESTAPELFTGGARMVPISNGSGKITPEHLDSYFRTAGNELPHNPQAAAVSITQASEVGLVYTPDEIKALSDVCKESGLLIHMDGARFANAVASLGCSPAELSWKSGIDVLCLGATKCGALCAEAVLFFNLDLAGSFIHRRKRSGHLLSKGRVFGSQFVGWLQNNHWLELAQHANRQASMLAEALCRVEGLKIAWPVQSNEIFLAMPREIADQLRDAGADFHEWYTEALPKGFVLQENEILARLVTSFETRDKDREEFCDLVVESMKNL